ncbi:neurofilament heavy polypeptide-like [Syngnathus typhle]|uniref:neurofilament heavy polypeptide-like n=1 Tax=Syngnathus typhle TaxID=161592 RepID=UPI002A69D8FB|nr:neurofilament heavy polypeptide-like [Syngnathus typhle]
MTDPNTPLISTEPQSQSEETQGTDPSEQQDSVQLRRSQRVKTLTEKGREMQDEKIKGLQQRFNYNYEKWRTHAKASKVPLSQPGPSNKDILEDITGDIRGLCADVTKVYDELRKLTPPDQETRRRADLCVEISGFLVNKATCRLEGREEQDWPEAGSLFQTTSSKSSSFNITKNSSEHSHRSSVKHQEAAAEAAASQAVLKILEEQQMEQQEIERLEVEVRKRAVEQETLIRQKCLEREAEEIRKRLEREAEEISLRMQREADEAKFKAQQEEEYAALQRTLDEKKRKVQHLEKVKDLKAAQARMQVYDQMSVAEVQRVDVTKINTEIRDVEHVSFPSLLEQVSPQAAGTPKGDGTSDLVKVLASALSTSRIPVPEPTVFSGDPLSYSDWKLSFQTLIDQKNIPNKEKILLLWTTVKDVTPSNVIKALEGDFSERALDGNPVPHEEPEEEKDIKRSLRKKTAHLKPTRLQKDLMKPSQKVHEEPKPSEDQEKRKPPKEVLEIPQKKQVDESLGEDKVIKTPLRKERKFLKPREDKDIQKPSQEDESKPSEMKEEKKPPKEEKPAPKADVSKKPFRFLRVTKKQTAPVLKKEHVNVTKEKVPKVKAKPEPLGKENEVKKPQKEVKKEDTEVKVTSKEVTKPQKQDKEVKVPPKEAKKPPKKLKELPSHEKEVRKPKKEEKSVKEVTKDELKVKEDKGVLSKPPKEQKLEEAEKPTSEKLPRKIRTIKEAQEKPPKEGKEDKRRPREDVDKALKRERLKEVEKPIKEANMSSVVLQETKKPLEGGSEVKDKRTSLKRFFKIHKEVPEAKKVTKDEKEGKTPP